MWRCDVLWMPYHSTQTFHMTKISRLAGKYGIVELFIAIPRSRLLGSWYMYSDSIISCLMVITTFQLVALLWESLLYANIPMGKLDRSLLMQSSVRPLSWLRFIDDIVLKWIIPPIYQIQGGNILFKEHVIGYCSQIELSPHQAHWFSSALDVFKMSSTPYS